MFLIYQDIRNKKKEKAKEKGAMELEISKN